MTHKMYRRLIGHATIPPPMSTCPSGPILPPPSPPPPLLRPSVLYIHTTLMLCCPISAHGKNPSRRKKASYGLFHFRKSPYGPDVCAFTLSRYRAGGQLDTPFPAPAPAAYLHLPHVHHYGCPVSSTSWVLWRWESVWRGTG